MSLLTICQQVAGENGLPEPSAIVGSSDTTAKRLYRLAQRSGLRVARAHDWTVLQAVHTFSTVASTASYSLPSDFDRLIDDTIWDRTNYWESRGPLSPQLWQVAKSGLVASAALRKRWRIYADSLANVFYIDPTPDSADNMAFEYVVNTWCTTSGGTGQTAWAADTDLAVIEPELIELDMLWRLKRVLGQPYLEEKDQFDRALEQWIARDGGMPTLSLVKPKFRLSPGNTPETGFGS